MKNTYDLKAISKEEFEDYLQEQPDKFYVSASDSGTIEGCYEITFLNSGDVYLGSIILDTDQAEYLVPEPDDEE